MTTLFTQWQHVRDEKNDVNRQIGIFIAAETLSDQEKQQEAILVMRYNALYEQLYALEAQFSAEDWQTHEAEQAAIRESERQAWLIAERYGRANPSHGIADWWLA